MTWILVTDKLFPPNNEPNWVRQINQWYVLPSLIFLMVGSVAGYVRKCDSDLEYIWPVTESIFSSSKFQFWHKICNILYVTVGPYINHKICFHVETILRFGMNKRYSGFENKSVHYTKRPRTHSPEFGGISSTLTVKFYMSHSLCPVVHFEITDTDSMSNELWNSPLMPHIQPDPRCRGPSLAQPSPPCKSGCDSPIVVST